MQLIRSRVVDVVLFVKDLELIFILIYSVKVKGKTPSLQLHQTDLNFLVKGKKATKALFAIEYESNLSVNA